MIFRIFLVAASLIATSSLALVSAPKFSWEKLTEEVFLFKNEKVNLLPFFNEYVDQERFEMLFSSAKNVSIPSAKKNIEEEYFGKIIE